MNACDDCLRRSVLIGLLAHHIANGLRERRGLPALLSLEDDVLIDAVGGEKQANLRAMYSAIDVKETRRQMVADELHSVCRHDADFPAALLESADAPAMLYLRGDRTHLARFASDPAVSIVGSRRASPYGLGVASSLGKDLSACGVVVVSGMAFGVDSAAHEGALAGGGLTVAVLGSGVDVPYPRSKRSLYKRIVSEGLVISEMAPGTSPLRWCFPARNRIMAALSRLTVVVEGTDNSGSLITAGFAAELGREVGAVPGHVTSSVANGPNALLADGAHVVRSASDVLDVIYGPGSDEAKQIMARAEPVLDDRLAALLRAVEQGKGSPDALASRSADMPAILAGLTELELMGLIRRGPDGRYIRCA